MKVLVANIVHKEVRAENTVPGRLYAYREEIYYATAHSLACLTNAAQSFPDKNICIVFYELPVNTQITCIQE